jgi:RND family efflux transporter MFP subunit
MKKRRTWIILIIVLFVVAGGGYLAYTRYFAPALTDEPQSPTLQTAMVYQGDILLAATGTGNLKPETEAELAFETSGVVAEVLVEIGDLVQAGDVLARLDDTDARLAVAEAEVQVEQAETDLALVKIEADAGLAQANLDSAQADYGEAAALAAHSGDQLTSARVSLAQTVGALEEAQEGYDESWDPARDWELYIKRLSDALENERDATEAALEDAQYDLQVAQANYNLAAVEIDESAVQNTEVKVIDAPQRNLEETTLIAPADGTIMDVAVEVGATVGLDPVITLADLETPLLRFWVEEEDLNSVAVGNPVSIVFDGLPDDTFSGEITRVDPELVTVDGTPAIQVWASVDRASRPVNLLSGLSAEVEITSGEAKDVLLVPIQALRELSPGQYAVFVVKADGELELRPVEVGLEDFVNAEIISGLELGEVVSTGMTESVGTPGEPPASNVMPSSGPGVEPSGP